MDLGLRGRRALITGGSRGIGFGDRRSAGRRGSGARLVARDAGDWPRPRPGWVTGACRWPPGAADVTDIGALRSRGGRDRGGPGRPGPPGRQRGRHRRQRQPHQRLPGEFTATLRPERGPRRGSRSGRRCPSWRRAGGGSVVIVSSITGLRPAPRTAYVAAKAAEIQLAATAAQELAPDGIRAPMRGEPRLHHVPGGSL